ncbi:MAG: hypothetical protein CM15mP103_12440 [Gammaproteobacteria bacterium]|nr:MAG: hypothetical protein CM15mP103_12440 [Gammaproteobacteria bacterium]
MIGYLSAGKLQDAERLCKYFCGSTKRTPRGWATGRDPTRKIFWDEAQFILETLHELDPENFASRY